MSNARTRRPYQPPAAGVNASFGAITRKPEVVLQDPCRYDRLGSGRRAGYLPLGSVGGKMPPFGELGAGVGMPEVPEGTP